MAISAAGRTMPRGRASTRSVSDRMVQLRCLCVVRTVSTHGIGGDEEHRRRRRRDVGRDRTPRRRYARTALPDRGRRSALVPWGKRDRLRKATALLGVPTVRHRDLWAAGRMYGVPVPAGLRPPRTRPCSLAVTDRRTSDLPLGPCCSASGRWSSRRPPARRSAAAATPDFPANMSGYHNYAEMVAEHPAGRADSPGHLPRLQRSAPATRAATSGPSRSPTTSAPTRTSPRCSSTPTSTPAST